MHDRAVGMRRNRLFIIYMMLFIDFSCNKVEKKKISIFAIVVMSRRAARGLSSTWSTLLNQLAVMQKNYIGLLKDSKESKFDLTALLCIVSLVDTAQFWCKQV
jgi:hypothetical protein